MAKKAAAGKPATKGQRRTRATNKTGDTAGVGNVTHPANKRVPDSVLIKRPGAEEGTKVTASPEVQGDKALMIVDVVNGRTVHVSLIEGVALTKDTDGRLVFIQGPVSNNLVPVANAKGLFAVKQDGTVIYNDRGFDDVAHAEFDMLDIVKLIEHNHK